MAVGGMWSACRSVLVEKGLIAVARSGFASFRTDRRGAVAVIIAIFGTLLALSAVMSLDLMKAYRIKEKVQGIVDQAAIAAAAVAYTETVGTPPKTADMEAAARDYLNANILDIPKAASIGDPTVNYDATTNTVSVSMPVSIETSLLGTMAMKDLSYDLSATAKRPEPGPLELSLVLDRTWSMTEKVNGVEKYKTLQSAANTLVDRVMATDSTKVGIVPFATWLNIEKSYWTEPWLYVPPTKTSSWTGCGYPYAKGCTSPLIPSTCYADNVPYACNKYGKTTCTYWGEQVCQVYTSTNSFGGCFGYRSSKQDTIASPTNPQYPGIYGTCVQTPILDLTSKSDASNTGLSKVKGRIAQLVPVLNGQVTETFIPGGLLWGWNMLNSEQPLTVAATAAEARKLGLQKALVLMTDGSNTVKPSGNSFVAQTPPTDADALTAKLCTNIKAEGIIIYSVAFAINNSATENMLRNCASGPDSFYNATSSSDLERAFQRIGASLLRIRLVK